jgi:hypothetical protein
VSDYEAPFVFGTARSITSVDGRHIVDVLGAEGGTIRVQITEQQAIGLLSRLGKDHSVTLTLELAGEKCMTSAIRQAIDDLYLTRFSPENKEEADAFIRRTDDDVIRSLRESLRGGL